MDRPSGFAFFEHTADMGLRAWGPDFSSALLEAARGLMQLITGGEFTARGHAQFAVEVQAASREELVVAWLQELLVRFELEQLVSETCVVHELAPTRLRATVTAQRCDPSRDVLGREVKAITYHQLSVTQRAGACEIRVIVDV